MYCVKCGVELADGESKCPLCGTTAYHPDVPVTDAKPPYPVSYTHLTLPTTERV